MSVEYLREQLLELTDQERDELLARMLREKQRKDRLVSNFTSQIPWLSAPAWANFAWLSDDGLFFWTDRSSTDALTKAEFFKRVAMNQSLHGVYRWFGRPAGIAP